MNISTDDLKYRLIRGVPIHYNGINIKQPTIADIDRIGILTYLSLSYIFRIQKKHLELYDDIKDKLIGKSLFESIIIQEEIINSKENFAIEKSLIMLLIQSVAFFLDIQDFKRIGVSDKIDAIIVYDFKEINGEIYKIPIFQLDNNNFEEFSEIIRLITYSDIIQEEKEEDDELEHYKDENLQRIIEEQYKKYKEDKRKEEEENKISINEIIGTICVHENSRYDFSTISNVTIWQLHYYFNFLLEKENIEITKSQFTSGNYTFEKVPDMNWIKKTKINLSKYKNLIDK